MRSIEELLEEHQRLMTEARSVALELAEAFRRMAEAPGTKFGTPTVSVTQPQSGPGVSNWLQSSRGVPLLRRGRKPMLEPRIIEVMTAAGRPMARNEIYSALIDKGVTINGKDPKANLSAHLSYSSAVRRREDGRFELVSREVATAK